MNRIKIIRIVMVIPSAISLIPAPSSGNKPKRLIESQNSVKHRICVLTQIRCFFVSLAYQRCAG